MIKLSLKELKEIEKICYETNVEYFELERDSKWSLGGTLKMQYNTFVSNYSATVIVDVIIKDW
jgi:hypothetical protein